MHPIIGWRERIYLPGLWPRSLKCKVDSGAKTSTLHARILSVFEQPHESNGPRTMVRFAIQGDSSRPPREITVPLLEFRQVRSSNGQLSRRPVIVTTARLMDVVWPIEVTLADRTRMRYPMLLGRDAIRGRFLVDVNRSFVSPKRTKKRQ